MADAVGSAVAQEAVSRAVSFVLSNREAAASKRLEMAHTDLEFALERSSKLPITDVSLLKQRRMVKRAYEECGDVLHRCKLRVLEDEKVEQGVTHSSSLPKRIIHAVKLFISSSVSLNKDELSCSDVGRFEWFADKAGKFVRDVETGSSLAHYRFFSPLIRPLLEGKDLWYKQVRGSRTNELLIWPVWSEERGVEALICFSSEDCMTPKKTIWLAFLLRLSESMDVVAIAIKCLQLLGPVFKPFAEVAMGELAQLPTQHLSGSIVSTCLLDTLAAFQYNLRSSANRTGRNVLELQASIAPHHPCHGVQESYAVERIGGRIGERINGSLRQMEEMQLTNAIDLFIRQPEQTEYEMVWQSAHGGALFTLGKPTRAGQ